MLDQGPVDIFAQICLPLFVFYDIGRFFEIEYKKSNLAFSVSVYFGFEPPNKLNFSYGAGVLQSST